MKDTLDKTNYFLFLFVVISAIGLLTYFFLNDTGIIDCLKKNKEEIKENMENNEEESSGGMSEMMTNPVYLAGSGGFSSISSSCCLILVAIIGYFIYSSQNSHKYRQMYGSRYGHG